MHRILVFVETDDAPIRLSNYIYSNKVYDNLDEQINKSVTKTRFKFLMNKGGRLFLIVNTKVHAIRGVVQLHIDLQKAIKCPQV
jgi:hypothetical protein